MILMDILVARYRFRLDANRAIHERFGDVSAARAFIERGRSTAP